MSSITTHSSDNAGVEAILARIKQALGIEKDAALAALFGVSRSQISGSKAEGAIPYKHLDRICRDKGLSMEWVLHGAGPRTVEELTRLDEPAPACRVGIDFDLYHQVVEQLRLTTQHTNISQNKIDQLVAILYDDARNKNRSSVDVAAMNRLLELLK